jgi:archaemetzincin
MKAIYFVPIGEGEWDVLEPAMSVVEQVLGTPCRLGESLPHPDYAHNRQRDQYLAGAILRALREVEEPDAERLLGVADLDLYAPGLNFVFGQATMGGRKAVIALPRLRQSFYGLPDDPELYQARVVKEAVHELGHTYGLSHCHDPRCVMSFSNSLRDVDRKSHTFCPACRARLPSE